jgi:capsule polysaccharide export protein KpsE/RkpR
MLTISTYLKAHEKLIIFLIGFVFLYFVVARVQDTIAAHDKANLTSQQAVLQSQVEKNNALAVQVQNQAAQYQALAEKVQAQNSALEQANVALATALTKQQKTDASLDLPALALRWGQLVPNSGLSVTNGQITSSDAGAHATVAQLELVPAQQQELATNQTEIKNDESLISASNASINTLNLRISGLNAQVIDQTKECTAQIAVVKAANHKANRRWFLIGLVSGFAAHLLVK